MRKIWSDEAGTTICIGRARIVKRCGGLTSSSWTSDGTGTQRESGKRNRCNSTCTVAAAAALIRSIGWYTSAAKTNYGSFPVVTITHDAKQPRRQMVCYPSSGQ